MISGHDRTCRSKDYNFGSGDAILLLTEDACRGVGLFMALNEYARIGHMSPEKSQANWIYLLRKYIPNLEKMRILDVGAGKGTLVKDISNNISNSVVGLDSSQAFKSSNGEFLQGDCHHLPFRDEAFDLVVSIGMLEHVDDYEAAILEMKRVSVNYIFLFCTCLAG